MPISLIELLNEVSYKAKSRTQSLLPSLVKHYTGNDYESVKKRTKIYRGTDFEQDYGFVQPSKFERKSANTLNFYTLIIDNSKYWSKYPKRSKSIVCSTSTGKADGYGNTFQIIPKANALIAICPAEDIWISFKKGFSLFNKILYSNKLSTLDDFNDFLSEICKVSRTDDYKTIVGKINANFLKADFTLGDKVLRKNALQIQPMLKNPFRFIEYCLSPKLNGFALIRYDNKFKVPYNRELWIGADSLLIKTEDY